MKEVIQNEKYGEIVYEEGFWLGRKTITVNGTPLTRISKKEYQLPDGTPATIKGNFMQGACLVIGSDVIQLTPKIKWYEIALCLIPIILVVIWGSVPALVQIVPVVGGALGAFLSALCACAGLMFMKKVKAVWQKLLIALATTAVAFGVCCIVGIIISIVIYGFVRAL